MGIFTRFELLLIALIVLFSILAVRTFTDDLKNEHISEQERTEAFNEGVEHGVCITVKAQVSASEVDKCFAPVDTNINE